MEAISTTNLLERNDFYSRLYGQTPILIASGKFITSKDILSNLKTPDDFTPAELEEVNTKLNDMISTVITGRRPLPEMAAEATDLALPQLQIPEKPPRPLGLQRITVDAIKKSLQAPRIPDQVLSDEEYKQLLFDEGKVEKLGDSISLEEEAERLIKEWQDRNTQLEAFKSGIADMPEFKLINLLMQPLKC